MRHGLSTIMFYVAFLADEEIAMVFTFFTLDFCISDALKRANPNTNSHTLNNSIA